MLLIIGGSGSGKSSYAEKRIMEYAAAGSRPVYYLATMQVHGVEGLEKVKRHKDLRKGKGMRTIEQAKNVRETVMRMDDGDRCVLLEDLGNLVANEMFTESGGIMDWQVVAQKVISDVEYLHRCVSLLVIVTNNVFEDGISYEEGTRNYVRALACVNRALAGRAVEVIEVVVGIPQKLK